MCIGINQNEQVSILPIWQISAAIFQLDEGVVVPSHEDPCIREGGSEVFSKSPTFNVTSFSVVP